MPLDLSSLEHAVGALKQAVCSVNDAAFMTSLTPSQENIVRAGVVQHFEFTYELCWRFMQRWIRRNVSPAEAEPRTRKDLFRIAARQGLIPDPLPWFEFAEARNMVAHTYDAEKAIRVVETAKQFFPQAKLLLAELRARND